VYAPAFGAYIDRRERLYNTTTFGEGEKFRIALNWAQSSEFEVGHGLSPNHALHPFLLALYTNLGEAQAKLDATAAARTGGDTEPPGPCI
jgi:hypothetical protein